jgi:hypothetical protein
VSKVKLHAVIAVDHLAFVLAFPCRDSRAHCVHFGILAILEKFPVVIMGSYRGFLHFKLWRTARRVLAFMKRKHPSSYYDAAEIIRELKLKKRQTWNALEKLESENRVHRRTADEALGGALWVLDELER